MIYISITQKQRWLEVFDAAMALYCTFKDNPNVLRVKMAEYRQEEVAAEPLDFCIDIDIKAKRALNDSYLYSMFMNMANSEQYHKLPEPMKVILGRAWLDNSLSVEGHYARLYYKTKNEQIRRVLQGEESHESAAY